jgi:Na+/proline symporter
VTTQPLILDAVDWTIVVAYFATSLAIALYFTRRAGRSADDYFASKGQVGWLLAGTSMVATTFAADTPLAVTEIVAANGIAGNWLWWNMVFGGMFTVFFFARLWRRSGVLTDVEFTELRYAGRSAAFLRGFRAVYLALPFNCLVIGWVNRAMVNILTVCFYPERLAGGSDAFGSFASEVRLVLICFGLVGVYSLLSGLWGVIWTDAFQFVLAMTGCIVLAFVVVDHAGGVAAMTNKLATLHPGRADDILRLTPSPNSTWMPPSCFAVMLLVPWWSSWYPGSEPGGGAFVAQRMFSAKDERHSLFATLWFYIAHFALRPWPWIFTGIAALVLYPNLENRGHAYPLMMKEDYLPIGLRGLLLTAFLAAYMSTISTLLNWGASYLVNDVYRRFLRPQATDAHYVLIGRLATLVILTAGGIATFTISSISGAWKFVLMVTAGTGTVYMLRWYWWRINAWSEIAAMAAAFASGLLIFFRSDLLFGTSRLDPDRDIDFAPMLVAATLTTTVVWLTVTCLTRAEPPERLASFFRKIRPGGPGWGPVAAACPDVRSDTGFGRLWGQWALACVLVLGALFGVGETLLGRTGTGLAWSVVAAVAAVLLWKSMGRSESAAPPPSPEPPAA